jgi:hypothetical protein
MDLPYTPIKIKLLAGDEQSTKTPLIKIKKNMNGGASVVASLYVS